MINKIKKAAKTSEQADKMLRTLFPEVFEEDKYFDLSKLDTMPKICSEGDIFTNGSSVKAGFFGSTFLQIRSGGKYKNKAFYLYSAYNWEIIKDDSSLLCLVPTK